MLVAVLFSISAACLNPLFIRSQFQMLILKSRKIMVQCLNPLFIRSQFQMLYHLDVIENKGQSQSLIHQVSVSDCNRATGDWIPFICLCLNPLFIRSQFQIAAFFQPINTDTYDSLFCSLSFSSLFSSLQHLISHRKQQFLSAITNNYKFPVTTPFFGPFFNSVQLSKLYTHLRF